MKNILMKMSVGFAAFGALLMGAGAKAAADTDLTAAVASTTSIFTDNKGILIGFFVAAFGVVIIIRLIKRVLHRGGGMITKAV